MSYHLGLLTFDPDVQSISKIRNEMAKELFLGLKNYPVFPNTETGPMSKRCVTATRHRRTGRGGRGGICPPKQIEKSKSRANLKISRANFNISRAKSGKIKSKKAQKAVVCCSNED